MFTYEFLLINVFLLAGPLVLSFEPNVRFVQHWQRAFTAILPVAAVLLLIDIIGSGHFWGYSTAFTLPFRPLGLPPGAWLYHFTVPFGFIFTWEVLRNFFPYPREYEGWRFWWRVLIVVFAAAGVLAVIQGLTFTAIVMFVAAAVIGLDRVFKAGVFPSNRYLQFLSILILLLFFFNLYLTYRPLLIFKPEHILGLRLISLPVEKFVYDICGITAVVILYEMQINREKRAQRGHRRRNGNDED